MSTVSTPKKRLKPDGSVFHLLSLPEFNLLPRYAPVDVMRKMNALADQYKAIQESWDEGGVIDLITGEPPRGTSAYSHLFSKLTDAWSGQHSDQLQRSHDSRIAIKKWEPVYRAIQSKLVAIEDELVELMKPVAAELEASDDWTKRNLGFELGLWCSERSY